MSHFLSNHGALSDEPSQKTPLTGRGNGAIRFPSSKHWRDPFFAFLFIAHLFVLFAIAVSFGIAALTVQQPIEIDIDSSGNESSTTDGSSTFETSKVLVGIVVSLVSGAVLSVLWIRIMIYFAASLITCSLFALSVLSLAMGIALLSAEAITAGTCLILSAILPIIYFYWIKERLAFASANLSVACKALTSVTHIIPLNILTLLITAGVILVWIIAFIGVVVGEVKETVTSSSTGLTYKVSQCISYDYINSLSVNAISLDCDDNDDECHVCICSDTDIARASSPCITYSVHSGVYFSLLLSLIWIATTSAGIQLTTTAGSIASWWFNSSSISDGAASSSAWIRSCSYSLGSIALASLISSILTLIHIAISFSSRWSMLSPLTACLRSALNYYHEYALVYCSIYGTNYLDGCKATNHLFGSLGWNTVINDTIINKALTWGNVLVSLSCASISYFYCKGVGGMDGVELVLVTTAGVFIGYAESMIVLRAVEAAVGTIYVCFAEEAGVGKTNHPAEFNTLIEAWIRFYPKEMEVCGYVDLQETDHGVLRNGDETTIQLKMLAEV